MLLQASLRALVNNAGAELYSTHLTPTLQRQMAFNNVHKWAPSCWCWEAQFSPLSAKFKQHYKAAATSRVRVSIRCRNTLHRVFLSVSKKRWPMRSMQSRALDGDEMAFLRSCVIVPAATITFCALRVREGAAETASLDSNITHWLILRQARDAFSPARQAKLINLCCRRVELKWFLPVYKLIFHARQEKSLTETNASGSIFCLLSINQAVLESHVWKGKSKL